MQAELTNLEKALLYQAQSDASDVDTTKTVYSRDWWTLSRQDDSGEHTEQWKLLLEVQECLDRYNTLLVPIFALLADMKKTEHSSTKPNCQDYCRSLRAVQSKSWLITWITLTSQIICLGKTALSGVKRR